MASTKQSGITKLELAARPSSEFQGTEVRIGYEFASAASQDDVAVVQGELQTFIEDLAEKQLEQLVAKRMAEAKAEKGRQEGKAEVKSSQKKPAETSREEGKKVPDKQNTGEVQWEKANRPQDKGYFYYRPSRNLSSSALREMVETELNQIGDSAENFDIYDDRVGKYGIESGNLKYQVGTVKPKEGTELAAHLKTKQGKPRAAYVVDFKDDGSVQLTETQQAKKARAGEQGQMPF